MNINYECELSCNNSSNEVLKIFYEKTIKSYKKNLISNNEKNQLLKNFKASIDGYTYFEN